MNPIKSNASVRTPSVTIAKVQRGFTLIEIMVVVVIMGILAGLVGVAVFGNVDKANVNAAAAEVRTISQALEMYRLENNRYPSTDEGLQALIGAEGGRSYLDAKEVPKDPWKNPYNYISNGARAYELYSFGADGVEGGEGFDADISAADL